LRYTVVATNPRDTTAPLGVPVSRGGERAIVLTSGYDQASRAVVLPFAPDADTPTFAVKVASTTATAVGTLREHERLVALHRDLPKSTARALPVPMGVYTLAERTACIQSCAPGPSMSATVGRWGRSPAGKSGDLDVVVDWLTEFAIATRVDANEADRDWTSIYTEARAVLDLPTDVVDLLDAAETVARSSEIGKVVVHQHYDAGPWNVHIDGTKPLLIDWETDDLRPADCRGPALADVLYLVTYWYFLVTGTRSEDDEHDAIERLFVTSPAADEAVVGGRAAIERARASLGFERDATPAVLCALWAERAVYTHRRRTSLGVLVEPGGSRPEAYLRALARARMTMSSMDDW
jgi:hypothetical protein